MSFSHWLYSIFGRGLRRRSVPAKRSRQLHRFCFELLEDRIVPASGSFNENYITQVYTDLLHRTVDSGGLSFWSTQITNGEPLDQVILNIEQSIEWRGDAVAQAYATYLNRPVDLDGLVFWSGELEHESIEQMEAGLIGSQEFYNDAGDTTEGFLEALYEDALDGPVDPAGNAFWGGELAQGKMSRTEVAYDILTSPEHDTEVVEGYYEAYLHTAAPPQGVSFWDGQMEHGDPDQSVIAAFLSSSQYYSHIPSAPTITSPASALTTTATSFTITGLAENGSLVQIYDTSGDVVASEQLVGSQSNFSITVPLTSNAANNFFASDINSFAVESAKTPVPTITQSPTVVNFAPVTEQKSYEGDVVNYDVTATDSDGLPLTYSATGLPSNLTIDSSNGDISGTIQPNDSEGSPYSVEVTATDGTNSNNTTFKWLVDLKGNLMLTAPGDQTNFEGNDLSGTSVAATAAENNNNTLTYTATGLPTGLSINSSTGVISGLINPGDGSTTPYTVNLSVTDGLATATATFTWTVHNIAIIQEQENNVGDSPTLQVTSDDPSATFTATGVPAGLTISSSGLISGTITTAGTYTATVTATDGAISGVDTFTWLVYAAGDPLLIPPSTQQNLAGTNVGGLADSVKVTVGGTPTSPIVYSASGLPTGLSINDKTGAITGKIATPDSDSSPYNVTVTATEGANSSSATFNWVVLTGATTLPYSLKDPNWVTLPSGVRIWDLQLGTGTTAAAGNNITANYIGYLADGTIFNQFTQGFTASLTTGTGGVIAGFADGVEGMNVGGTRLIDIPSALAYGNSPPSGIPANAELVFLITLTNVTA